MAAPLPADGGIQLFPVQASTLAGDVDAMFFAILGLSIAMCIVLFVLVWVFSVRFWHSREAVRRAHAPRGFRAEFTWTAVPILIFIGLFAWGAALYLDIESPPPDALQIHGVARQWMWKFEHPGGQREIDALHVPLGRPVVVTLISQDVIHSFFVPPFRVKQDVLPGRYTRAWFEAVEPGRYRLLCAEFCGTDHAAMQGVVVVMPPQEYQAWLERNAHGTGLAAEGKALFVSAGCAGCHDERSTVHAPRLAGLYGRQVHLSDGSTVTVDEAYLRDSILLPERDVAAGYAPLMPSFAGQLDEGEIMRIVAYIRSLGEETAEERDGRQP